MLKMKLSTNSQHLVVIGKWDLMLPVLQVGDVIEVRSVDDEMLVRVIQISQNIIKVLDKDDSEIEKAFEIETKNIFAIHKKEIFE